MLSLNALRRIDETDGGIKNSSLSGWLTGLRCIITNIEMLVSSLSSSYERKTHLVIKT